MDKKNSALIRNVAVCEAGRLLDRGKDLGEKEDDSRRLFDLISVIEAVILNEHVYTLPRLEESNRDIVTLRKILIDEGILSILAKNKLASRDSILKYDTTMVQSLIVLNTITDSSAYRNIICLSDIYRDVGPTLIAYQRQTEYTFQSQKLQIPLYPLSDKLFNEDDFKINLKTELYAKVVSSFSSYVSKIFHHHRKRHYFIPPLAAIVLDRAKKREDIIDCMLELRLELRDFRKNLLKYQLANKGDISLKGMRLQMEKEKRLMDIMARRFSAENNDKIEEAKNYIPELVKAVTDPLNPAKYSPKLVSQPIKWLRHWRIQRPMKKLIELSNELVNIKGYEHLMKKHFPEITEKRNWEDFTDNT